MEEGTEASLQVTGSIGFNNCIVVHPSNMFMIWAIGNLIVIRSSTSTQNEFLKGHENKVVSLAVSPNGKLLASGEEAEAATLVVWDFESKTMTFRVRYHRHGIPRLSFNADSKLLVSLGSNLEMN